MILKGQSFQKPRLSNVSFTFKGALSILLPLLTKIGDSMTQSIHQHDFGNLRVTSEVPKAYGKPVHAFRDWLGEAGGAYETMSTMKKLSQCIGRKDWADACSGYTAGAAVPRLLYAIPDLYIKITEANNGDMSSLQESKIRGSIFGVGAATMSTITFLDPANKTAGNAGIVLYALSDVCELKTAHMEVQQASRLRNEAERLNLSPEMKAGAAAKHTYTLMKGAKAIISLVSSFFAVQLMATGVAVLGVGSALTLGIAGSVTNIVSYFYEKCYSNYFAKIEVVPLNS